MTQKEDSQKVESPQERHLRKFRKTSFAQDAAQERRISRRRSKNGYQKVQKHHIAYTM